jgi:4-oxalocrotonate tautomerase
MPYLNVRLSGSPSQEVSAKVALALTELTAKVLKKKREVTAVTIDHVPPQQWYIGGVPLAGQPQRSFYLDIKVTEGTNTKDEKALFVSSVFKAIEEIVGPLNPASYIVIHDVRADSWGYQGQTQEFRYIKGKAL